MTSTTDRLIAATRQLLWERGYVGTSPKAIQTLAGVGQGSMYHHFASKADLARAAEQHTVDELKVANESRLHGDGTAAQRLISYLRHTSGGPLAGCPVGRLSADPDIVSDDTLRAPLAESLDWTIATVADVIREAQADGTIDTRFDANELAATMAATRQGAYVLARALADPAAFDRAIDGLLHTIGLE